jgi:hypothetical protein
MTQTQTLRRMFEENGGRLTLGEIMRTYLGASYRQRLSDLRRELIADGKTIICHPIKVAGCKSHTWWQIEDLPKPVTYVEPSGQMAMVIR